MLVVKVSAFGRPTTKAVTDRVWLWIGLQQAAWNYMVKCTLAETVLLMVTVTPVRFTELQVAWYEGGDAVIVVATCQRVYDMAILRHDRPTTASKQRISLADLAADYRRQPWPRILFDINGRWWHVGVMLCARYSRNFDISVFDKSDVPTFHNGLQPGPSPSLIHAEVQINWVRYQWVSYSARSLDGVVNQLSEPLPVCC